MAVFQNNSCESKHKDTNFESNSQPKAASVMPLKGCESKHKDTNFESNSQLRGMFDEVKQCCESKHKDTMSCPEKS